MYVCMYIYIYMAEHTYIRITHIYSYICTHTCICMYIYTHTYQALYFVLQI